MISAFAFSISVSLFFFLDLKLLYGEKDTANKNASIELAELLKNVELKTIIGAGHEVNIESPQELAEILHAFYERMS